MTERTHIVSTDRMATSHPGSTARLRVEPALTGFFENQEFQLCSKLSGPIVIRLVCPVDFILHELSMASAFNDFELYLWGAADVTPSGTFTDKTATLRRKNAMASAPEYTKQSTLASGGSITVVNADNYLIYSRLKTSGTVSYKKFSVGETPNSQMGLAAGTYYIQITGTGTGEISLYLEERP